MISLPEVLAFARNVFFHSISLMTPDCFLDTRPAGPELDLCNQGEDWTWHTFDLHDLAAGKHSLKFAGRGASPKRRSLAQAQFAFGLNSLVLLRLEDMDGYEPTPETHPKK